MAEGYLRAMAEAEGIEIEVASAGLATYDGSPPSENSVLVMEEEGIDISDQISLSLTASMVEEATHVFGMARSHVDALRSYFPEALERIFVLREFVADEGLDIDVPDPIGGDLDDYRVARNLIKEAMASVMRFVRTGDPG
jgi:protein-tyrosine-phosphatase